MELETNQMRDLIGRTLGHYRIVEKIGAGGMGEVYRARDLRLDRDVAIKVLPEDVARDPDRLARFEREAKAVAKLDHPNILAIHDFGNEDGVTYAVTEIMIGQNLKQCIPPTGMSWNKVIEIGAAIGGGLATAHGKGIIHRDLKPENIFITSDGRVKILDFGLAQLKEPVEEDAETATLTPAATLAGTVLGTMGYMSPEQLRGEPSDARSDIFALGCVLYEMLSGQTAFLRKSTAETSAAILKEEPPGLSGPGTTRPEMLERTIRRCLEKSPEARFQSASDLAFNLHSITTDQEVSPVATHEEIPSMKRRRMAWSWGAAATLVVAVVALWIDRLPPAEKTREVSIPRIVVLPFENLGSPDDEYFADGITEEITSRLAAVSGLHVISRTSAMHYKGRIVPLAQIGDELDVGYVLEGTIRWDRSGGGYGRVRITPRLIKVEDDSHLWTDRYDRVLEDIFTVQSDIAEQVLAQLQTTLLKPERQAIDARPTGNMDAFQAYLLGVQYKRVSESAEDLDLAVEMFERAVALDPDFALAFVELAETHALIINTRHDLSPKRFVRAADSIEKAFEIEPDLPEVHRARGYYYYWALRDYDGAINEFSLAAEGRPGDADVYAGMGFVMRRQGRMRDSISMLEKAIQLDPRSAILIWDQAGTQMILRDYEKAVENFEKALSIAPDFIEGYFPLAETYRLWDGSPERARGALELMPAGSHPVVDYSWVVQELYERNYQEALDRLLSAPMRVFEVPRQFLPTSLAECECLLALGRPVDAEPACKRALLFLEEAVKEFPDDPRIHSALGKGCALVGRGQEAIRHGRKAVAIWPVSKDAFDGIFFENYLAEIYALAGEPELATAKLEYLLSIPSLVSAADLRFNPKWDALRDHPRFQALLEEYDN